MELHAIHKPISKEDAAAVKVWIESITANDHPFDEPMTYDATSSDSCHRYFVECLQKGTLKNLFENAAVNIATAKVCACIEMCTHVAYVHSSLRWCTMFIHPTRELYNGRHAGIQCTLDALMRGDPAVNLGRHLTAGEFASHPSVQKLAMLREISDAIVAFNQSRTALQEALNELYLKCFVRA